MYEYTIVKGENFTDLVAQVNERLNQGWSLVPGGLVIDEHMGYFREMQRFFIADECPGEYRTNFQYAHNS
jgi:hypothetical protein